MKIIVFIIANLISFSSFCQNLNEDYYIFDKKPIKLIFSKDSLSIIEKKTMNNKIIEKITVKDDIFYILENKFESRIDYIVLRIFKIDNDLHLSILYDRIKELGIAKENIKNNNFENKVSILLINDSLKNDSLKSVMTLSDKELILIMKKANEELRKSKIKFEKSREVGIFYTNSILMQMKKMNFNLFSISAFLDYIEKKSIDNADFMKEKEEYKILKQTKTADIDR